MDTDQMSTKKLMDEQIVTYPYNGILLSNINENTIEKKYYCYAQLHE